MNLDKGSDQLYSSHPSSMMGNPALGWLKRASVSEKEISKKRFLDDAGVHVLRMLLSADEIT